MTPKFTLADLKIVEGVCRKLWGSSLRGGLSDFDEVYSRVVCLFAEHPADEHPVATHARYHCRRVLTDLKRERDHDAAIVAHLSFEAQRPTLGDVLPADFAVPFKRWGGARKGAGRPKKAAA